MDIAIGQRDDQQISGAERRAEERQEGKENTNKEREGKRPDRLERERVEIKAS